MTETMVRFFIGDAEIEWCEWQTKTTFPDGSVCLASHDELPDQQPTAEAIRAPSVHAMNRTHDLAHSMLSQCLWDSPSATLMAHANGQVYPLWRQEEAMVLAFQAWAFAAGIDLVHLARVRFG